MGTRVLAGTDWGTRGSGRAQNRSGQYYRYVALTTNEDVHKR